MGQSADGPGPAPSVAEPEESDSRAEPGVRRKFFGRILGKLNPTASESVDAAPVQPAGSPAPQVLPGLGNLRRMRVEDVAIPKVAIAAVPVTISRDDLVDVFREQGFSRMPVFKGTLDSPLGLIHLKDLALEHGFAQGAPTRFSLRKMLRPLLFAPPSMPIGVLLQKMQRERIHMALVIDEYGGVDGLVTIEDLIEQVIGEIEDEHDEAEGGFWTLEKPGQYLVQARVPLDEFEAQIGMKLADAEEDEEIDTLGGFVCMLAGRVPARGEVIPMEGGFEFEVVDADPRRVKRIRVRLPLAVE
ncbi:hemolysin family protein [Phaeovulum sp.]|uniref:hemolysin family protein n=1 Tax=Phaeovulum sp. TaxID=2934796 RepID=UPI0027301C38|nr:hemolysin family protein [Phaeovulum sp.]MDP1670041.1 hemolysin family protein [Phaeovulum sp.]MDP3862332.1 hemolysin family protein [Phaeovulum sp.]MDZ4119324.1 hemolysin family protein [Phaeovulum sp.]